MSETAPEWAVRLQRTADTVRQQTLAALNRADDLEEAIMATQEDINALAGRVDAAATDIRADIQRFIDAHPELDTTPLESAVTRLEGLAAENQPTPAPAPEPSPTPAPEPGPTP